jgi:hypothetical protein
MPFRTSAPAGSCHALVFNRLARYLEGPINFRFDQSRDSFTGHSVRELGWRWGRSTRASAKTGSSTFPWGWFMGREHLQDIDLSWGHELKRTCKTAAALSAASLLPVFRTCQGASKLLLLKRICRHVRRTPQSRWDSGLFARQVEYKEQSPLPLFRRACAETENKDSRVVHFTPAGNAEMHPLVAEN